MGYEEDVLSANHEFYAAFDAGDIEAMEALWAEEHGVACIHPGWSALDTRAQIVESWRSILDSPQAPDIRCANPTVSVAGDMGFVVCTEILSGGELVATNIFVRESTGWKICHHHAAPVARHIVVDSTPPDEMN
ncbi:MAG: nuclear transport factor 2 family protein [Proteobacteria bacterium]|nr:nuclear transport factor 2 family protein [Pseudomonadota bacterium]